MSPRWLPAELWRHIFLLVTVEEFYDDETEYRPFKSMGSDQSGSQRRVSAAFDLFRVCKQWQAIAAEFLFRQVRVGHGARTLLRNLGGSRSRSRGYGRHVRRIDLPSKLVPHDMANPVRLLDILAYSPRLEILVKPPFDGRQDFEFWSNLISAARPRNNNVVLTSLKRIEWSSRGCSESKTLDASGFVLSSLVFRAPNLRDLSISSPWPIFKNVDRIAHPKLLPFLTKMHLGGYTGPNQMGIKAGDMPSLTHLVIHPINLQAHDSGHSDLSVLEAVGSQLRVVELYQYFGRLNVNFLLRICPNLQELAYHIGYPQLFLQGEFQHLELKRINMQKSGGFPWHIFYEQFTNICSHAFPALERVILHGDWDNVVREAHFDPVRQLLLDRSCLLEYADGTPVHGFKS